MDTLLHSVPLTLKQATTDPRLPWILLDTHRQVWVSFLWGSLLLSPGSWCSQSFVCALQESVSPVLCKFWWLYGGVNGDLLQEGLCHTQVCTQSPWPIVLDQSLWAGHAFCALSRAEQLRRPGAWQAHCPTWTLHLNHLPGPTWLPSQVCCMSPLESWSQAVTLLVDVNYTWSQDDVVRSWEPAHSLVEDAFPGTEIVAAPPCLLALAVASLPLCLWSGRGWYAASWLSFGIHSVLCSVSRPAMP